MAQRLLHRYYLFFPSAQHCFGVAQRDSSQSEQGGMPCQRAGSGAEAREKEENCLRFLILGLSVNADASTPPQPLGL